LNFSGRQNFKNSLLSLLGINLGKEVRRMKKTLDNYEGEKYAGPGFKVVIFDFSALSYIDSSGVYAMKVLVKEFTRIGVTIYMAGSSCKFGMIKLKVEVANCPLCFQIKSSRC
jgi:STAS domain